jgi:hypothetical protein
MPPQKKKKEETGSKFKCNYSGHGKPDSQVFEDKNLELLKQNGWGGGGKKFQKNWTDREKAYNDLMWIMGQKVQRTRTRFWRRTTGGVRRRRRRRRNNIRFSRTMLMSLISFISSTGV